MAILSTFADLITVLTDLEIYVSSLQDKLTGYISEYYSLGVSRKHPSRHLPRVKFKS